MFSFAKILGSGSSLEFGYSVTNEFTSLKHKDILYFNISVKKKTIP